MGLMLWLLRLRYGQSVENVRILADSNGTTVMLQWRRDRVVGLNVGFLLFLSVCVERPPRLRGPFPFPAQSRRYQGEARLPALFVPGRQQLLLALCG